MLRRWRAVLCVFLAGCSGVITDAGEDPEGELDGTAGPSDPAASPAATPVEPGSEFACDPDERPSPPLIRRLTRAEYLGSIEQLTGVTIEASAFPPDDASPEGFSNQATGLTVQYDHARDLAAIATRVVQSLPDADAWLSTYAECREATAACRGGYIDRLARAAFGSPPIDAERSALLPLFEAAEMRGQGFAEGALDVLEAVLQSPRFVYRMEDELGGEGERRPLEAYELARRLALLVTGRVPDAALLEVAESGGLETEEGLTAELDRLLASEAAREGAHAFVSDWLSLDSVAALDRDAERFEGWSDALPAEMRQETIDVFDAIAFSGETPLVEIFNADFTIVGPALAAYYGFEESGRVSLADVPERGGVMTHAGILAATGGARASSVDRGFFVSALVTCGGEIAQPPDNADLVAPDPEAGASIRTHSEYRVNDPVCGSCHSAIEPPVWGLMRYDGAGSYSETDPLGNVLPTDGYIRFVTGGEAPYESTGELGTALAAAERVQECLLLQMSTYALGRHLEPADACEMAAVRERFFASAGTYRDLLLSVALSPLFQSNPTTDAP